MSTNSRVGKLNPDGTVTSVYGHWDGDRVGDLLSLHYSKEDEVDALLSLGDFSSLRPNLYPKGEHSYENPEEDVTVFCGRDRGESDVEALTTTYGYFTGTLREECTYLYREGKWTKI